MWSNCAGLRNRCSTVEFLGTNTAPSAPKDRSDGQQYRRNPTNPDNAAYPDDDIRLRSKWTRLEAEVNEIDEEVTKKLIPQRDAVMAKMRGLEPGHDYIEVYARLLTQASSKISECMAALQVLLAEFDCLAAEAQRAADNNSQEATIANETEDIGESVGSKSWFQRIGAKASKCVQIIMSSEEDCGVAGSMPSTAPSAVTDSSSNRPDSGESNATEHGGTENIRPQEPAFVSLRSSLGGSDKFANMARVAQKRAGGPLWLGQIHEEQVDKADRWQLYEKSDIYKLIIALYSKSELVVSIWLAPYNLSGVKAKKGAVVCIEEVEAIRSEDSPIPAGYELVATPYRDHCSVQTFMRIKSGPGPLIKAQDMDKADFHAIVLNRFLVIYKASSREVDFDRKYSPIWYAPGALCPLLPKLLPKLKDMWIKLNKSESFGYNLVEEPKNFNLPTRMAGEEPQTEAAA